MTCDSKSHPGNGAQVQILLLTSLFFSPFFFPHFFSQFLVLEMCLLMKNGSQCQRNGTKNKKNGETKLKPPLMIGFG